MGLKWFSFLIGPPYLIGIWFGEDQRVNIIKYTCVKEIGLRLQLWNNYSTLNIEHNWEDLCIMLRNQQTCTSDNHNYIMGGPNFQSSLWTCFIVDLLMQHKFCSVNLVGRSWRTCKMNQTTPTCLTYHAQIDSKHLETQTLQESEDLQTLLPPLEGGTPMNMENWLLVKDEVVEFVRWLI